MLHHVPYFIYFFPSLHYSFLMMIFGALAFYEFGTFNATYFYQFLVHHKISNTSSHVNVAEVHMRNLCECVEVEHRIPPLMGRGFLDKMNLLCKKNRVY